MSCSSKQSHCDNHNGELHASQRHVYTDGHITDDKKMWNDVPRHRIAGKQRMPPYMQAPVIQVPEPKPRRSRSKNRDSSKERELTTKDKSYFKEGRGNRSGRDASVRDRKLKYDAAEDEITREEHGNTTICLPTCNFQEVMEPLCIKDAVVMVVNQSCLSGTPSTSKGKSKKAFDCASQKSRKSIVNLDISSQSCGKSKVTFDSSSQLSRKSKAALDSTSKSGKDKSDYILENKVPPMYIPRPCHKNNQQVTEYEEEESEASSIESETGNDTPWGNKLPSIKVTRIKRENDEDDTDIEAPKGSLPLCARCGVAVYLAEEKGAAGRKFHSSCFKCFLCNAALDSFTVNERNQEIYCRHCYIRQFGPKGYDFGAGEGALRME